VVEYSAHPSELNVSGIFLMRFRGIPAPVTTSDLSD